MQRRKVKLPQCEGWLNERASVIVEAYETAIKRRVPMGGKEQPIENVQPLGITATFRPWHDVAGAQKRLIADPGDGATPGPVVQ